jgi:DNA-binding MarR family transcriptional regulator
MEPTAGRSAPARLRTQASWLLNQVAVPANRLVSDGLAERGTRRYHYALLAALDDAGPSSQAELSRRTGIDRSDMVAAVNELSGQGYVERATDPADRRRNLVTMTPAGRRRLAELDRLLDGVQDRVLEPLSAGERTQLIALLTRLADHHHADPDTDRHADPHTGARD